MAHIIPIASALVATAATTYSTVNAINERNQRVQQQSQQAQASQREKLQSNAEQSAATLAQKRAQLVGQGLVLTQGSSANRYLQSVANKFASRERAIEEKASLIDQQEKQRLAQASNANNANILSLTAKIGRTGFIS